MKIPRWMHKAYANFFGYFWLPCPLCDEFFGGHEWKIGLPNNHIITGPGEGKGICPNCHEKAKEYNENLS